MSTAMPGYDISTLAAIAGGESSLDHNAHIRYLVTDSRKGGDPEHSLFFAIKGTSHDGHAFIPALYEQGFRNFVVQKAPQDAPVREGSNFLVVEDPLRALQRMAAHHRSRFTFPVIAITGSNGKTIVKEWLFQLMREDRNIVRSPRSYNSQLGVSLSVWQMQSDHELGLFEAGISQPGEMTALEEIIRPDIGLITNVGHAHDENFGDHEAKTREKLLLFRNSPSIVYCKDHALIHAGIQQSGWHKEKKCFTWSRKGPADLMIGKVEQRGGATFIQGTCRNRFMDITIPFTDSASVENAIHCWALLLSMNYDPAVIRSRMMFLAPVAMRLELKEGVNHCSVINDFYNSDLESLNIALDFLKQQKQHPKRTLILSDILQSGKEKEGLYAGIAAMAVQKGVDRIVGIGPSISSQAGHFPMEKDFYPDTGAFLQALPDLRFYDETILLKGARSFGFERISRVMQQKAHETVLEINLTALGRNLQFYRSLLKPETRVMAMVKAFSYGSGSFEIANALQFYGVDYLAVAYADEGVALRKAGVTLPIMVMSPQPSAFETLLIHNLEAEIYSPAMLDAFIAATSHTVTDLNTAVPIHLKLDTGMHRLGFRQDDLNPMIVRIRNNRVLQIKSIFTHLAASDEAGHDAFTREQVARFEQMSDAILPHFSYPILRHALNTSGIRRFPEAQYDMVRLGIGLYGVDPSSADEKKLSPVGTLKTTISQVKTVPAGETVGYSREGKVTQPMEVATVPIGYADGYDRRLGNGKGHMMVKGKAAPTIGNICMDMCMLDVTGCQAKEGDEAIVFGEDLSIRQLARASGTIPYEILTGISGRVKRVYYQE